MDRMREIFPGENDDKIIRRFRAMNENGLRDLLIFHVDDQEDITSTTEFAAGAVTMALTDLFGKKGFNVLVAVGDDPRELENMYREEEEEGTFQQGGLFSVLGLDLMFLNNYGNSGHGGKDMLAMMDKIKHDRITEYLEVKGKIENFNFMDDDSGFFLSFSDELAHLNYRLAGLENYLFRHLNVVVPLSTMVDEDLASRDAAFSGLSHYLCSPCEKNAGRNIGFQLVERAIKLYTGEIKPVNLQGYRGNLIIPNLSF
ncbi:hypothetical protein HN681_03655 [archaeon]|nr:hypothetical protein [archaeon]MBT4670230.1 hypothetical protein [archaeon]MBT5030480.1 hypothetical protein [archaeon]MBT5287833.1 hypothetical protein [archaeon]MBT7053016.1 hypothetical protein [archaeon]